MRHRRPRFAGLLVILLSLVLVPGALAAAPGQAPTAAMTPTPPATPTTRAPTTPASTSPTGPHKGDGAPDSGDDDS